jgi:hypothetical protein
MIQVDIPSKVFIPINRALSSQTRKYFVRIFPEFVVQRSEFNTFGQ